MSRSYFLLQGLKEIISILQAQKNGKLQIVDDERDIKSVCYGSEWDFGVQS